MKRSALLVLSSLLLTSASYAANTKCEDCYDLSTKHAAALHHTVSKPNSPETRYWDDYLHSGTKDITVYIRDLSRKDAQAALWFITTGGKHGFAAREATAQERVLLEDAIKNVAISYGTRSNTGKGLQEWSQVSNANHAGHLHLQMIYRQIDDLKSEVNDLNVRVNLLEKAKEEGLAEIKLIRAEANQAKIDSDKKFTSLSDTLIADSNARKEELKKLPALLAKNSQDIKTMMDKYEENWKTTLTAWTTNLDKERDEREKSRQERENFLKAAAVEKAAYEKKLIDQKTATDALLEAEKAKIQAEVDRQKGRKKIYKDQVIDYKLKAVEAEKAKAVADALKEEREAAALKEKQRDDENKNKLDAKNEEVRKANERERAATNSLREAQEAAAKEREAMARERADFMKMMEAFQKGQIPQPLATGSQVEHEGNSSNANTFDTVFMVKG